MEWQQCNVERKQVKYYQWSLQDEARLHMGVDLSTSFQQVSGIIVITIGQSWSPASYVAIPAVLMPGSSLGR